MPGGGGMWRCRSPTRSGTTSSRSPGAEGAGVRCFYDADEQTELWGKYLAEELPRIYARESAAAVVFLSADYAGRDWSRLERRAAFSRAVAEAGVYVLPARFDDSELPGLLPDVVTIDLRRYAPAQFANLIVEKLAGLAASPSPPGGTDRSPAGAVRVEEADPRRLGVHAAISVPGVPGEVPPEYMPRDVDAAESGRHSPPQPLERPRPGEGTCPPARNISASARTPGASRPTC